MPFAGLISLFVAIADLIPLVGATLGAIVAVVAAFVHSVPAGIAILIFFVVYQQLENHLLQPLILSRTVDLNPLTVLVAILVAVELAGILGALLAIPVAGMIQVILPRPVGQPARPAQGGAHGRRRRTSRRRRPRCRGASRPSTAVSACAQPPPTCQRRARVGASSSSSSRRSPCCGARRAPARSAGVAFGRPCTTKPTALPARRPRSPAARRPAVESLVR